MAVYQLNESLWFPDPHGGEEDGLIAMGGDLSVNRLVLAYSYGIFPWYCYRYNGDPLWYCPMERFVIFPDEIHISHSMRQLIKSQRYQVTFNEDFPGVIDGCARAEARNLEYRAWLGPHMVKAFTELHKRGFAASVEVWEPQGDEGRRLVGGLYGVTLRDAFFGESMFSLVPSASKLALIRLAQTMAGLGYHFIDCQFETPHLRSMGGRFISYDEYMSRLT